MDFVSKEAGTSNFEYEKKTKTNFKKTTLENLNDN